MTILIYAMNIPTLTFLFPMVLKVRNYQRKGERERANVKSKRYFFVCAGWENHDSYTACALFKPFHFTAPSLNFCMAYVQNLWSALSHKWGWRLLHKFGI